MSVLTFRNGVSPSTYICECDVAGAFPFIGESGFVSVTLRTNTPVFTTTDMCLVLSGPTAGELTATGYGTPGTYSCPGRAGISYDWIKKYDCLNDTMHFIPRAPSRSFVEGDVTNEISMVVINKSTSISASASSGPTTVYINTVHYEGYDLNYTGGPIPVSGRDNDGGPLAALLPADSKLYLTNFSWDQTPPGIPMVSYTFMFDGNLTWGI